MPLNIDFTISPVDPSPLTYTVGGNTYPPIHQVDGSTRASDSRYAASIVHKGVSLTLTAVVVATGGSLAIEYRWDFGDGKITYGPVVTHTYLAAAPQTAVTLTITDQRLARYTRQRLINLRP